MALKINDTQEIPRSDGQTDLASPQRGSRAAACAALADEHRLWRSRDRGQTAGDDDSAGR